MKETSYPAVQTLEQAAEQVQAIAFSQERFYGNIVAQSLEKLNAMREQQEKAKSLPHNAAWDKYAISTSVLTTEYDRRGAVFNDKA